MEIAWSSDRSLLVTFADADSDGAHARVVGADAAIRGASLPGVMDVVPAYASIMVLFQSPGVDHIGAESAVRAVIAAGFAPAMQSGPTLILPCCYEGAFAPDLSEVAALHSLSPDEVIGLHAGTTLTVRFVGFSPGFPYMAGLPECLHTPRLSSPRTRVPAGSVAIAGAQAGVYPQSTPGGWRILGRTPAKIFDPARTPHTTLVMGTHVRFRPISAREFDAFNPGEWGLRA